MTLLDGIQAAHAGRLAETLPADLGPVGRAAISALDSIPPIMRAALATVGQPAPEPTGEITDAGEVIMSDGSVRRMDLVPCHCGHGDRCPVHYRGRIYALAV